MRNSYIFEGVDEAKVKADATIHTAKGDDVFIHYHKHGATCNDKCHRYVIEERA